MAVLDIDANIDIDNSRAVKHILIVCEASVFYRFFPNQKLFLNTHRLKKTGANSYIVFFFFKSSQIDPQLVFFCLFCFFPFAGYSSYQRRAYRSITVEPLKAISIVFIHVITVSP